MNLTVCCSLGEHLWAWKRGRWPGGEVAFLDTLNADIVALGATSKAITGDDTLLVEANYANAVGLKITPMLSAFRTTQGETHSGREYYEWMLAKGILANTAVREAVNELWVADDVQTDNPAAMLMRRFIKKYIDVPLVVTPDSVSYAEKANIHGGPSADKAIFQCYPCWPDQDTGERRFLVEEQETIKRKVTAAARWTENTGNDGGIAIQGFGSPVDDNPLPRRERYPDAPYNYHYLPQKGDIYQTILAAYNAGLTDIWAFKALWWTPVDDIPWTAIWDHRILEEYHDFERARTWMFYEIRAAMKECR